MWINRETYRKNVSDLARLKVDSTNMERLKVDTFRLNKAIEIKDRAFTMLKVELDRQRGLYALSDTVINKQKGIIASQGELLQLKEVKIQQLEKTKYTLFQKILLGIAAGAVGYLAGKF